MYSNLRAEMTKKKVTVDQIAKKLQKRRATISDKVKGKFKFYFREAVMIRDEFFPEQSLEFLFAENEEEKEATG